MSDAKKVSAGFAAAFILTLSLFALWGMGQQLCGVLLPQISGPLHLQGAESWLAQNATGIFYMLGAIPAAFYATRLGYKAAILFGLGCVMLGMFTLYPAIAIHAPGYFLVAITIMSLGWVFLDVAANPLAASLGSDDRFVWRLNVAQAVYPLGTIAAIVSEKWLLGTHVGVEGAKFTFSAATPYILLGAIVFLIAYLFEGRRFPAVAIERKAGGEGAALRRLLSDRRILAGMVAQAIGILILIGNGSIGGRYLSAAFHADVLGPLGNVFFWATLVFAAGRLGGCALMRFISPVWLLAVFAVAGVASSLIAAHGPTMIAGYAVLANQFFAAILWPTILGLTIRGRGPETKFATALVCMGGAAGGNIYQVIIVICPSLNSTLGMVFPALCFAAIFGFALARARWDRRAVVPAC